MTVPRSMKNPNFSMRALGDYKFKKGIPTRETCDLNDPKEMFLWMFVAMPGLNGAPLVMPIDYLMMLSEHMYECGARLTADPIKKYRPPASTEPHWATSPGTWVPIDAPDPVPDPVGDLLARMGNQQKAALREALIADKEGGSLDTRAAAVVETMTKAYKKDLLKRLQAEHESDPA